jgi:hypothetical protein
MHSWNAAWLPDQYFGLFRFGCQIYDLYESDVFIFCCLSWIPGMNLVAKSWFGGE